MNQPILSAHNLSCARGERLLFDGLSFDLMPGELVQVVGPNGTGKTSLLRALTGVLSLETGDILWQGQPIQKYKALYHSDLLYIGHKQGVKSELTVFENVHFNFDQNVYSDAEIMQALDQLNLREFAFHFARQLSQGQRQRTALTKLLLNNANLWILDEPLAALDVHGVEKIQAIFRDKITAGGTILFTTHQPLTGCDMPIRTLQLSGEGE